MKRSSILALLVIAGLGLAASVPLVADTLNGEWQIRSSKDPGEIRLTLVDWREKGKSLHHSNWPLAAFDGLNVDVRGRQDVAFALEREAGRTDFRGRLVDGEGEGTFRFTPSTEFRTALGKLGFTFDLDQQFGMALQDVTVAFVREMKGARLTGLDSDRLIAFRVHGVSLAYIEDLRALGRAAEDSKQLIAFRVHGVTPKWVKAIEQAGVSASDQQLIALKVHGASEEWIASMADLGYSNADTNSLIAFRVHGVTPAFVRQIRDLGLQPEEDQLIAFRVHGVSPSYVVDLRTAGADLTTDQFIAARVHDISPQMVADAKQRGLKDLDLESLLSWKRSHRH